ncbi:MAG: hypothetical protein ACYS21_12890, partial [Planctomycetota bacterium]
FPPLPRLLRMAVTSFVSEHLTVVGITPRWGSVGGTIHETKSKLLPPLLVLAVNVKSHPD